MTYKEALTFLHENLPMFQRIGPAAFKKDLGNTQALLAGLGNPERAFLSIHIAGTNGKGSVSHFLASILQAAGFKTGLYISPHYKDFRERIKINGRYIAHKRVVGFVEKNKPLIEQVAPSYFEMCVAMAFDHFAREKVDIAVVETGLGGRLDSTNVLKPILTIITNISFDHQNLLGDTLELIAGEKAGIIKAHTPIIIGERQTEVEHVFIKKATEEAAPLHWAWDSIGVEEGVPAPLGQMSIKTMNKKAGTKQTLLLDADGSFQLLNAQTTLAAVAVLNQTKDFFQKISPQHIQTGLAEVRKRTRFIGRWQVLQTEPLVFCDSAHNAAGIDSLVAYLSDKAQYERLFFVFGTVSDKDPSPILAKLPKQAQYFFVKANVPRGMAAHELLEKAKQVGLQGHAYTSVRRGLAAAKRSAKTKDLIVIAGSIFVVAEVL